MALWFCKFYLGKWKHQKFIYLFFWHPFFHHLLRQWSWTRQYERYFLKKMIIEKWNALISLAYYCGQRGLWKTTWRANWAGRELQLFFKNNISLKNNEQNSPPMRSLELQQIAVSLFLFKFLNFAGHSNESVFYII
jgi:hypothetical protein